MKNLLDKATAGEVKERIGRMTPDSRREWGTMNPAQTLAHCSAGIEMALGELKPPRVMVGRVLGPIVKGMALRDDAPMRKNSPTAPSLIVKGDRKFPAEQVRLIVLIDRFTDGGEGCCTTHPHAFFGELTPQQWAILMYKHLDHHLRQFGV